MCIRDSPKTALPCKTKPSTFAGLSWNGDKTIPVCHTGRWCTSCRTTDCMYIAAATKGKMYWLSWTGTTLHWRSTWAVITRFYRKYNPPMILLHTDRSSSPPLWSSPPELYISWSINRTKPRMTPSDIFPIFDNHRSRGKNWILFSHQIKQESVQSTFTNVSSSSLNRAVAQFIDVTVYRLQGAMSSAILRR